MRLALLRGKVFLLLAVILLVFSGCAWMGKAAGKAQAKVENKIEAMDRSYQENYEKERNRGKQDSSGEAEKAQTI